MGKKRRERGLKAALFVLLLTTLCGVSALAEADKAAASPRGAPELQVALELQDGSRLKGAPTATSVALHTAVGKLGIPLKQVRTIRFHDDRETVTLTLKNNDRLSGVLDSGQLEVRTIFGPVTVELALVKELTVNVTADAGAALLFDGTDDYVHVPHSESLSLTNEFTVELWVWPLRLLHGLDKCLVAKDPSDTGRNFHLALRNAADVTFAVAADGNRWVDSSGGFMKEGEWRHVAGVYDHGSLRVYIDGALRGAANVGKQVAVNTAPLTIGADARHPLRYVNAVIDEVRLSRVARYKSEFVPERRFEPDDDTVALFHFDEGEGTAVQDSSQHANHGEIRGAVWTDAAKPWAESASPPRP